MRFLVNIAHHTARIEEVIGSIKLGFTTETGVLRLQSRAGSQALLRVDQLTMNELACLVILFDLIFESLCIITLACHILPREKHLSLVFEGLHEALGL